MSELGKVNQAYADRLFLCAKLLLDRRSAARAQLDRTGSSRGSGSPLELCAWRRRERQDRSTSYRTRLAANHRNRAGGVGTFTAHGKGNYDVAALCLKSGVDINEVQGRTLLHASRRGDLVEPGGWWIMAQDRRERSRG